MVQDFCGFGSSYYFRSTSAGPTSLIGTKSDGMGGVQATRISLSDYSETELCPTARGSEILIKEIGADQYLISAYDSTREIVSFYLRQATGGCTKKNSIPVANPNLHDVILSPDQKKILVKASVTRENLSSDQIFYVPLSGEAPLVVNTALFVGAKVSSFQFLQDSRTILYVGDQLAPGEPGVFVWRAPQ